MNAAEQFEMGPRNMHGAEEAGRSNESLESTFHSINAEGGWTYNYDAAGWTYIYDEDGDKVTSFFRKLSHDEVRSFFHGYKLGYHRGQDTGKAIKAAEVRQALGL